jgi:hypothetical protein
MMGVLYFADHHLGVETHGGADPVTGKSMRLIEVLKDLYKGVVFSLGESVEVGV